MRVVRWVGLVGSLLIPLAACTNSPNARSLQQSLAADPQLKSSPTVAKSPTPVAATPSPSPSLTPTAPSPTAAPSSATPQPGDRNFVGPVLPGEAGKSTPSGTTNSPAGSNQTFSDLDKAPPELQQPLKDLVALGVLTVRSSPTKSDQKTGFEPNQPVTRREYARWLVATNNRLYRDRSAQQIRLASETTTPAFQDVPASDPDFAAIQGLAEAGVIPSRLSGEGASALFRPDDTLTREQLLLWKLPLDTRQSLPPGNVETVKQTWGFQDAGRIDPQALRAVQADFQGGDLSNIRRAFGFTTLFQPKRPVTRAEAATTLWYFGSQNEGRSAKQVLQDEQTAKPKS